MCKHCDDDWKESAIRKRDFQHSKDGPEVIEGSPKKKSKNKRWCKGKEGREHRYEQVIWYTYNYRDDDGKARQRHTYRWVCQGCKKVSWSRPVTQVPEHEHCFCDTQITERRWKKVEEIFESCCVCGGKGRSYKFYS
jgi:hypothetical protein